MAFTKITLQHPVTKHVATAPVGFSWTNFFFGWIASVFRGDFTGALILFALSITTFVPVLGFITGVVILFINPSVYNRNYFARLLQKGYEVSINNEETSKLIEIHGLNQSDIFPMRGNEAANSVKIVIAFLVFMAVACVVIGASVFAIMTP